MCVWCVFVGPKYEVAVRKGWGEVLSIFSHTHLLMIAFADNNDDDDNSGHDDDDDNNGHNDDDDNDINNDNDDDEFLGAFLRHEKRCFAFDS